MIRTKGRFSKWFAGPLVALTLAMSAAIAACQGCREAASPSGELGAFGPQPTLRLYVSSVIAGALEPCGCSKDQLGGFQHLGAFMDSEKQAVKNAWMVAAGPLFFMDPALSEDDKQQTLWKAEAIAGATKHMNLVAWAPGFNDWAGGADTLAKLQAQSGAAMLAGNLDGVPGATGTLLREVYGIKVGFFGLADPKDRVGRSPDSATVRPAAQAARKAVDELIKQGARVLVGVASLPRGDALRIADEIPEISVLVLGKPAEAGDLNDAPKPPVLLGQTLVVETSNHLQTVGVVDLYVSRDEKKEGLIAFKDAGGVAKAEELLAISARIRDLEQKINGWEGDKNVKPEDLAARKADLEKARAEKARIEATSTPVEGSYFRYKLLEVRDKLGTDQKVAGEMSAYYKRVNEHNKVAFADRKPPPVEPGKAGYVGVDACTDCHDDARKVWDGTRHAHAYATLQKDFKEYNLECTSCHVTGYGKPGGSTVAHVEKLQNVQCEVCHGPGSLHVKEPNKKGMITAKPSLDLCTSACHHPPHVDGFDAAEKVKLILGKGHGM
jgi:2',3'-cyclic-nucleotide 2'-phosphodiesterase (5'-nucleotidase family)